MSKIAYFILSENAIHIGVSENETFQWLAKKDFDNKTEFYYKEQLQGLIEQHNLSSATFDDHVLMWYSSVSSLVPMNLLENSTPREIIEFSFSENKIKNEIDYNRIFELSTVNIYEIPLWVKSFFVIRFPRIIIQHLGTGAIRGIFNTSSFKPTVHLFVLQEFALFLFVKHNELLSYNSFEYTTESDLIYYTLNILNQSETLQDSGQIMLHSIANTIDSTSFKETWEKIQEGKNYQVQSKDTEILKYLSVCV